MFKLKYKFISTIRRGSFGTVDLYRMRFSRKFYAVKNIRNCNFNKNEVICLKKMRGVHGMQQLKDVYMGKDKVKLVMEYYPGKDLFDRVKYQGFIKGAVREKLKNDNKL